MKKKHLSILIRTAGGKAQKKELGLGHIFRCINLAKYLKPHKIHFLLEDYGGAAKILRSRGFNKVILFEKNISIRSDIEKTKELIFHRKIDVLVVDKYKVKPLYANFLRKYVKTVIISDLNNIDYSADLLVNGFVGYRSQIKKNKVGTRCLLGPKYQILDKNFQKTGITRKKKYHFLVTLGGYDENNIIELVLEGVKDFLTKYKIKIILGPATSKSKKMKEFEKKYSSNLRIVKESLNMKREISYSEYGICGGGLTTYECATMRIPLVIICQTKHQLITARAWERFGYAKNLGLVNKSTSNKIKKFIEEIQNHRFKLTKNYDLDGKGVNRVSQKIISLGYK